MQTGNINRKPLVVSVVPGTKASGKRVQFRNVVLVPPTAENGLSVETIFQCHQLRAIDHSRFVSQPIGTLSPTHLRLIERAVKFTLGLWS